MSPLHADLAAGRWHAFPLVEQLANVGSEVERALNWTARGNPEYSRRALERALELLELTIGDSRHRTRLKELTRLREALLDYFCGENEYGSSEANWHSYFHPYGMAVAIRKHGAQ
ncbi:MAG: hypothetical protein A2133_03510 [Actinobacteria bacterium RBG_16_64_13]|nr:MAG: hypothetical protein A2133_03510 [Actinobacteria bacterium RBG_16_64_13]